MKLNDPVFGKFEINEPILIALINSPSMQRLKRIKQYGLPKDIFPGFSRYDHSIGVMLNLRLLNAPLDEQIAGLLHDISHTAFSHLIDWVVGDIQKENFQDRNHKKFILNSEIPEILKKYKVDTNKIIKIKSFPLLEQKAPNLCADRVDYSLREFKYWLNPKIVKTCVENLAVHKDKMVFKNKTVAKIFALNYLKLQTKHWAGKETLLRYYVFSLILKDALNEKIITMADFFKDDKFVLDKIKKSKNQKVLALFKLYKGKLKYQTNPKLNQIYLKKKFRYIDPLYMENQKLKRLSSTDPNFKNLIEKERINNSKGLKFNFISQAK